jgi:hypothetical protein
VINVCRENLKTVNALHTSAERIFWMIVKLAVFLTNYALRREDGWGSGGIDPRILDLCTFGGELLLLPLGKSLYWIGGGWVGPRAGLDDVEKRKFLTLPELELRPLVHRARSQSLYRLSYPGSNFALVWMPDGKTEDLN